MTNWKRIIAAAGTAALLISNLGSISQLTFATEPVTQPVMTVETMPDADDGSEDEDLSLLDLEDSEGKDIDDESDEGDGEDSGDKDDDKNPDDADDDLEDEDTAEDDETLSDEEDTEEDEASEEGNESEETPGEQTDPGTIESREETNPDVAHPEFQDAQTMSDGTVITVDAPEGAFPKGIQLSLEVKNAEDYLDAIRAYTGDDMLTADGWLAYDFDFYTDEEHHGIEPLSKIKVTFSHLTQLTERAEEAADDRANDADGLDADDTSNDIMLTDLDEDADETGGDRESASDADDANEDGNDISVTVYHIANAGDDANTGDTDDDEDGDDHENTRGAVTETPVTHVDPAAGTIEIETDQFSVQLIDTSDAARAPGGWGSRTYVDHIDIAITGEATVTIDGVEYSQEIGLERSDINSTNITITAAYENGTAGRFTPDWNDIEGSYGDSGVSQFRIGGTYYVGSKSDPIWYTYTLHKTFTFNVNGEDVSVPLELSSRFHYFQLDNDCPGIQNHENYYYGTVTDSGGMDFTLTFDIKMIAVKKEVVDQYGNLLKVSGYTSDFVVEESSDRQDVSIDVNSATGIGIKIVQVSSTNNVRLTESAPAESIMVDGKRYTYLKTTINDEKGLSMTESSATSFTVRNYYEGPPLSVQKKWYDTDGQTELTENLPDSITGILYQHDTAPATEAQEADHGVTLTIQASYRTSYYQQNVTVGTYTVATGGSFSGRAYAYYSQDAGQGKVNITMRTLGSNAVSVRSGSASVSNNGNNLTITNITENTTVLITYSNSTSSRLTEAPRIVDRVYRLPDETAVEGVAAVDVTREFEFTLTADTDTAKNWRKTWSAEELGEQGGHTYTYWIKEIDVPGYSSSIDYDATNKLVEPSKDNNTNTITITNTKVVALVRLKKVDEDGNPLHDATFTLADASGQYYDSEAKAFVTASGDTLPSITMGSLDLELIDGTYTLTETRAPDGYNRSDPKTIEIAGGVVKVDGEECAKDDDGYYVIEVVNTPGYALPDTGGMGALPYELGGSAALLGSMFAGCSMWRRRRNGRRCD